MSSINHTNNRGAATEIETFAMANCMMIAAAAASASGGGVIGAEKPAAAADPTCMFTCKTCDRKFASFQALGGHRASHKKIKAFVSDAPAPPKKPKTHACSICGQEFLIGQALGGHMRRHRQPAPPPATAAGGGSTVTTEGSTENSDGSNCCEMKKRKNDVDNVLIAMPEEIRSGGKRRISLDLDLNLFSVGKFETKKEDHEHEIGEGEIVEERDFLKLELRQPINC